MTLVSALLSRVRPVVLTAPVAATLKAASMVATTIDEAKDLLYGHPAESFVAEREILVKAIRAAGNRDLANETKALRKPSAVAALVNQVVRSDRAGVELILQAAALLRSAQEGALDGAEINASELQQQYRAAVAALAQSAPERRADVRAALEAATIDEASNHDLRSGCLVVVPTPLSILGAVAAPSSAGAGSEVAQPVDELEVRRARRRAEEHDAAEAAPKTSKKMAAAQKAAKNKTTAEAEAEQQHKPAKQKAAATAERERKAADKKAAAEAERERKAADKKAAAEAERERKAAEKKAAAEAERQRKAAEKQRQKELKAFQKQHREALRDHLAALDAEAAAEQATEQGEQALLEADSAIETAEETLASLREQRARAADTLSENERVRDEARIHAESTQDHADKLADTVAALEQDDEATS